MIPLNNALGWLGVAVVVLSCWWVWMVQQDLDSLTQTNVTLTDTNAELASYVTHKVDSLQAVADGLVRSQDEIMEALRTQGPRAVESILLARLADK